MGIMLASISLFCALFRHALIALGQPAPATKREAVNAVAAITSANPSAFLSILDLREGKRKERGIAADTTLQTVSGICGSSDQPVVLASVLG